MVVVRFWFVHLLPAVVADSVLDMVGRLPPAGNLVAMLVAIFWFGKNKPILDFFQRVAHFHFSLQEGNSSGLTLFFEKSAVVQFCPRLSHESGMIGFPSQSAPLSTTLIVFKKLSTDCVDRPVHNLA